LLLLVSGQVPQLTLPGALLMAETPAALPIAVSASMMNAEDAVHGIPRGDVV
jgi:hypothetical protein